MTGFNPSETTITPATVSGLTEQWHIPNANYLGEVATPLVADGLVIYSQSFAQDVSTGPDDFNDYVMVTRLAAYDLESGKQRWLDTLRGTEHLTGIAAGVAITAGANQQEGFVHAFDVATGRQRWTWTNPHDLDLREPVLAQGRVVIPGEIDTYVLDLATGRQAFTLSCTAPTWPYCPVQQGDGLAVDAGEIFAAGGPHSGGVQFSATDGHGQMVFTWARDTSWSGAPVVDDGMVYEPQASGVGVDTIAQVAAYRVAGCSAFFCPPVWSVTFPAEYPSRLAVADGVAYVRGQRTVRALDAHTGRQLWTSGNDLYFYSQQYAGVVVAGGLVYVNTLNELLAYRAAGCGAATCAPLWTHTFPGEAIPSYYDPFMSPPVITGGKVIFSNENGLHVLGLN